MNALADLFFPGEARTAAELNRLFAHRHGFSCGMGVGVGVGVTLVGVLLQWVA